MKRSAILNCLAAIGVIIGVFTYIIRPVIDAFSSDGDSIEIAILMYHHVTDDSSYWGNDSISSEEFENDLMLIKKLGFNTVNFAQLYSYVTGSGELPPNPVVITFDDGFLNYKDVVVPLLEKYNCRATLAITGEFTDDAENRTTDDPDFEYLKWSEIAALDTYYTEIAYHSYYSHKIKDDTTGRRGMEKRSLEGKDMYEKYLREELTLFNDKLQQHSMQTIVTAYPFGYYSNCTDELLSSMGVKVTLSAHSGINYIRRGDESCLFSLKRINRPHGVKSEAFLTKYLNLQKEIQ